MEKDYSKFNKRIKNKTESKGAKSNKQLLPVDFDRRKQIRELSYSLPQLPYIINVAGQLTIQEITKTVVVKGEEIQKSDPGITINGQVINPNKSYIQKGTNVRLLDHEVELTKAYQKEGQLGIDKYITYCNNLAKSIIESQEKSKKKDLKVEEDSTPYESVTIKEESKEIEDGTDRV